MKCNRTLDALLKCYYFLIPSFNILQPTEDKELTKFPQDSDEPYRYTKAPTQEIKQQLDKTGLLQTPGTEQKLTQMPYQLPNETLENATHHAKNQEIGRIIIKEMTTKQEKVETCKTYPVKRKSIDAVIKKEHMLDISRLVQKQQITQDDKTEPHPFEKMSKEPHKVRPKHLNIIDEVFTTSQEVC